MKLLHLFKTYSCLNCGKIIYSVNVKLSFEENLHSIKLCLVCGLVLTSRDMAL